MSLLKKPQVKAIVSIDGERVDFVSLMINQEMGEHHDFELLLNHNTLDASFFDSPEKKLNLIHSKVIIDIQPGDDIGKAYVFSGMATNVRMIAREGVHGGILITGKSNTVELERGEMCQSYSNANLMTILREVTEGVVNLNCEITPDWKADIDFALQYHETDWMFLKRICHQYQERFYYTGLDLIIGTHPEFKIVELTYDMELRSLEICSRLLPNQYSEYYYQRENHMTLRQDSPGAIEDAGSTLQMLTQRSDRLTRRRKPNVPAAAYVPDMGSLIEQSKRRKVTTGGQMMYIKGEAKTCDVLIGRLVRINMPKNLGGTDMGLYRVYKCIHHLDEAGHYTCYFEALPADLKYIPTSKVPIPTPNPIECEVWSNQDPQAIGRITVKFPFDERPCSTWMPVMTPDSGGNGSGLGPVSRGFSFIPEVSDSVLVSFIDGPQLSHPVVIGSMFHGSNAANLGGGKGNHIKTIMTRSGSKIVFNDDQHSIHIEDSSRNIVELDGRGNIHVNAPKKIILNSTEIQINGHNVEINTTNNLLISVGNNLIQNVLNIFHVSTAYLKQIVDNYIHLYSKTALISSKDEIKMQSEEINALGLSKLVLHSDKAIQANSLGYMNLKSSGLMNLAQDAVENKPEDHEEISLAIANFRPESNYDGEFGFDWFRIGIESSYPRYITLITGGFGFNRSNAILAFMKEFKPIPIKRPDGSPDPQPDQKDYYVSFLNIYPEAVSKAAVSPIVLLPYEAQLRIFVEVLEPIDKLELEYDKTYFSVDNDVLATCLTPGSYIYHPTITCKDTNTTNIEDMGHINEKEIKVWAYPDNCMQKSKAEQIAERKLAGKLIVPPNDNAYRKHINFVYVSVLIDITGTGSSVNPIVSTTMTTPKALPESTKEHLSKSLHQALIDCSVTTGPDLDLSADNKFKTGGEFIASNGRLYATVSLTESNEALYTYLKTQYDLKYPEYTTYFPVFYIDSETNMSLAGQIRKIGSKEVLLFKDYDSVAGVLTHEVFHGLGLGHSFKNGALDISSEQTYVFAYKQTENIMDYSEVLKDSWYWQWKVINPNAN